MSVRDIRLLEAVSKLHEVARVVYQDFGDGKLTEDIRKCADRLSDIVKAEIHTGK